MAKNVKNAPRLGSGRTGKGRPDLVRRHEALEKVAAKYRDRVVDFSTADCVRMARTHLVAMGHKPPKLPPYSSLTGAKRALSKMGHKDLASLIDSLLPRIPAARMLPGDIVLLQGEPETGLDSIAISLGGDKALAWYEGKCVVFIPREMMAAYRV